MHIKQTDTKCGASLKQQMPGKELRALGSPRKGPGVRAAGIVEGQGRVKTEGLIHRLDSEQVDLRSSSSSTLQVFVLSL